MEVFAVLAIIVLNATSGIDFDVPAMAPAAAVSLPQSHSSNYPNSRFVEVNFDVSTKVAPTFQGNLNEIVVEARTQHDDVQIADYSPRTEMFSQIDGSIKVTRSHTQERQAKLSASGFYPVFAKANGQAAFHDATLESVEQNEIAARQLITAAGTLDRKTGVFFKLRANTQQSIEGARRFVLLLEVPEAWRADLLEVRVFAYGTTREPLAPKGEQLLLGQRFQMALYQLGDDSAAQQALEFARRHVQLQQHASLYAQEIQRRVNPTPLHQIGTALNLVKPSISDKWLEEWVFGTQYQKPAASLPVGLKVVMLDFQEARTRLLAMAHLDQPASPTANYVSYRPVSSQR